MGRVAIDPVTRVGGHLRIEVTIDGGVVTNAWSSGTMFRGLEAVVAGRDPRDAWLLTERICGACTGVHALASVRAVERALGLQVPRNARLIRNIMAGAKLVSDHVVGFYHRHALDWLDVGTAIRADPAATATAARLQSDRPASTAAHFQEVRDRLAAVVGSSQPGPFGTASSGHPDLRLSAEASLLVMAHYLEALDWRRDVARLFTILGGKSPHPQTYLVGGMAIAPPWGGPNRPVQGEHPWQVERNAPAALSDAGLAEIASLLTSARDLVDQAYVPDALAIARAYPDWAATGRGIGNYLSFGEFPEDESDEPALFLPHGRVMGRNLAEVRSADQSGVAESVAHSHYTYDGDDGQLRSPADGLTTPRYEGPTPPYVTLEGHDKYSWVKAPRYEDDPMEVGPLARMLVATAVGGGDARTRLQAAVASLGAPPDALYSTLGRTIARAIEAQVVAAKLPDWLDGLIANLASGDLAVADITRWDPDSWPSEALGWSVGEAPRGAVGHWLRIADRRIERYQVVDATTWNASPRDDVGRRGALEEALVGTPVADANRPIEVLRTVHSFDPCPACAIHALRPGAGGPVEVHMDRGGGR